MTVALIADAHLGGPGGPSEPLIDQVRALADAGCDHMVFMGDLFHVWVGDRRYETPEVASMVDALRDLRRAGVTLEYVEGNRDFFLDDSVYADAFDRIALEITFEVSGVRYLAVHGDGLNDSDWRYRFWRWLSKSWLSGFLVRRVPGRLARRLVNGTEQRLSKSNFRHKNRIPEEVISSFAERRLEGEYDVLLLGHFHEPRRWKVPGGEVRIIDAWYNEGLIDLLPAQPASGDSQGGAP